MTTRVALMATCLTDTFFPDTARAVVRLLERLDCAVEFPAAQTCCGQMHYNTGYRRQAAALARRTAKTFDGYDAVVAPSGSCVGMVRDLYPGLHRSTTSVAARTYELTRVPRRRARRDRRRRVLPAPGHLPPDLPLAAHARRGGQAARPAARGARAGPGRAAGRASCCGFGGTFALKNADTSTAMLADKMRNVLDTRAQVVTAGDNSCLMHIGGGLSRLNTGVRALHLAEILASTEEDPWR